MPDDKLLTLTENSGLDRRTAAIGLALICLAALGLRLYRLGHQSLWIDEVYSVQIATLGWGQLLAPGGYNDIHPPLYFAVLKPFHQLAIADRTHFEFFLRLPSAFFSVLTVAAMYWLTSQLFDRASGLLASGLAAIGSFFVWYAQETRMYAVATCLVVLNAAVLVRTVQSPRGWHWWLLAFGATAAGGLAHWYAVFVWPALLGYALLREKTWARRSAWIVIFALAGAVLSVYLYPKLAGGRPGEMSGSPDFKNLAFTLWSFWTGYSAGPNTIDLHGPDPVAALRPFLLQISLLTLAAAVVGVLTVQAVVKARVNRGTLLLVAWVLLTIVGPFLLAIVTGRRHNPRYSFAAAPAAIMLIAAAIRYTPLRWSRMAILTCFVLAQCWCLGNYYGNTYYAREDFRGVAELLANTPESQGQVLTCLAAADTLGVYGADDWMWKVYPHWEPWTAQLEDDIQRRIDSGKPIWHIAGHRWGVDERPLIEFLEANCDVRQSIELHGFTVREYHP